MFDRTTIRTLFDSLIDSLDDSFRCPKCSYKGTIDELSCYNCENVIVLNETKFNTTMQCSVCGIAQTASCPNDCGANITIHTIEKPNLLKRSIITGIIFFGVAAIFVLVYAINEFLGWIVSGLFDWLFRG